jgi:hypothetical protein
MPRFTSTLYRRFGAIDITIYAYLGIGDVCEHILGHRQRLRSRNQDPGTDEEKLSKIAVQVALFIPETIKIVALLLALP